VSAVISVTDRRSVLSAAGSAHRDAEAGLGRRHQRGQRDESAVPQHTPRGQRRSGVVCVEQERHTLERRDTSVQT